MEYVFKGYNAGSGKLEFRANAIDKGISLTVTEAETISSGEPSPKGTRMLPCPEEIRKGLQAAGFSATMK